MMTSSSYVLSDQHPTRRLDQLRRQESRPARQESKILGPAAFVIPLALLVSSQLPNAHIYFPKVSVVEESRSPLVSPHLYPGRGFDSESHMKVQNR